VVFGDGDKGLEKIVIEQEAREYLKSLAQDGLDTYLDRIWGLREPTPPRRSSTAWPYKTVQSREDDELMDAFTGFALVRAKGRPKLIR
jgi:hypothetical protein